MRNRKKANGITVNVIAGIHVVFFGLDIEPKYKKGFLGFAIKRKDHSDGEVIWLKGIKTFEKTEPHPVIGETFTTIKHPIQSFQWADYSVKPNTNYTYNIVCLYGNPANLENKREVEVPITTEKANGETHDVFFNRGSVATQEYARRFMNKIPSEAGPGAYKWLSRGLLEALIEFIGSAKAGNSIHGAVYEFQYPDVLKALKEASKRGVKVKILFDDVEQYESDGNAKGPWQRNREEIARAKIKALCKSRSNAKLMHNKFFILSKSTKNIAVWTGSTNLTENGIFGHSNLGHIVKNEAVANSFMDYWQRLNDDPEISADYRNANMEASPVPEELENGTTAIFSPRGTKLDSLEWYSKLASAAKNGLFMTFAFGMHENFKEVYRTDKNVLKMALMEKAYASLSVKERDEKDIQEIRNLSNVVVSIGNRIVTNAFDRWLKEMYSVDGVGKHVYWIHTKYMLVDPLSNEPIIISGSANFSKASTDTNDENMLVIKGNKRVADIYFSEYIRLFSHYSFREAVKRAMEKKKLGKTQEWKPQFLETKDNWMNDYFNKDNDRSARCLRRKYFSGPMSL
jgi:phosphatidylserine/phosphatidylglycerophosphate/cardiolipin synthase-like enzyme